MSETTQVGAELIPFEFEEGSLAEAGLGEEELEDLINNIADNVAVWLATRNIVGNFTLEVHLHQNTFSEEEEEEGEGEEEP